MKDQTYIAAPVRNTANGTLRDQLLCRRSIDPVTGQLACAWIAAISVDVRRVGTGHDRGRPPSLHMAA